MKAKKTNDVSRNHTIVKTQVQAAGSSIERDKAYNNRRTSAALIEAVNMATQHTPVAPRR